MPLRAPPLHVLPLHALALLAGLLPAPGNAVEACRFTGTTSHDGRVAVRTEVSEAGGLLTVDVAVTLAAQAWLSSVQYLAHETSTWRRGELQRLAVNNRSVVNGRIRRQQWDVFTRGPAGLEAHRVQAKTTADFQRRHSGFARHWPLAAFGQPWLPDYPAAVPERRPDLDLPATTGLRPPLALAFYWSRWLAPEGGAAQVVLPGFKQDARATLAFGAATPGEGWRRWQAPLRHPGLSAAAPSTVAAWASPDGYLLQLAFEVAARQGSGRGVVRSEGCQGVQVAPGE